MKRSVFNSVLPSPLQWVSALAVAAAVKVTLLFAGAVPFNSDEAVVGLMARHILQGERPVFFYGQAYMGSLDAWLVAGSFMLFGQRVASIRLVQLLLYLVYLTSLWVLAYRVSGSLLVANLALWIGVIPSVLVTTYTTATLGGYGELLVLGNLILWLAWEIAAGKHFESAAGWFSLGITSGLAFWVHGLAVIYMLAAGFIILWRLKLPPVARILSGLVGFFIGSAPWWFYNLENQWQALLVLIHPSLAGSTLTERMVGLILLGLPAVIGARFPWSPNPAPPLVLIPIVSISLAAGCFLLLRIMYSRHRLAPGVTLLIAFVISFFGVFLGSRFGIDATGRYLLPLNLAITIGMAVFVAAIWSYRPIAGLALLLLLLSLNAAQTLRAVRSPDRITTQFNPETRFDNQHDQELVDFLKKNGELRGHTNYWVSFRLAFLSKEQVIYAADLPYRQDFSYTETDNRYPLYAAAVAASPKTAYITSINPRLDDYLRSTLGVDDITFDEAQIGDYHVFYNLSVLIHPQQLGLGEERP